MRKCLLFVLICLLSLSLGADAYGAHAYAFDLNYKSLGANQYQVDFVYYRACDNGSNIPSSVTITARSSCTTGVISQSTSNTSLPINVTPVCPTQTNTCQNSSSPFIGIQMRRFTTTFNLPVACSDWIFGFKGACCRAANSTLSTAGGGPYIEARLNNTTGLPNTSPSFIATPNIYACINQAVTFDNAFTEPDGDSLVFSLTSALQNPGVNWTYNNVTPPAGGYQFFVPILTIPTNPIAVSPSTGKITFTPSTVGKYIITIKADEYRGGVWIGNVMREIPVNVSPASSCISGTNPNKRPIFHPLYNLIGGTLSGSAMNALDVCSNTLLSFTVMATDSDAIDMLQLFDTVSVPGATFTQVGTGDTVYGQFSWMTPVNPGVYTLGLLVSDENCNVPGIQNASVIFFVRDGPVASLFPDTTCNDGNATPITMTVNGGSTFNWSVVSGDMGSLNSTTGPVVTASPNQTTTYVVQSDLNCNGKNTDTLTVTALAPPALASTGGGDFCGSVSTTLVPNATGGSGKFAYNWSPSTGLSATNVANPLATPLDSACYIVTVTDLVSTCVSTDTVKVNVAAGTLDAAPTASSLFYCAGTDSVVLRANVTNGDCNVYAVESIPLNIISVTETTGTPLLAGTGSTTAKVPLGFSFPFYCNTFDEIQLSSAGFIYLTSSATSPLTSQYAAANPYASIPSATAPDNLIAFGWSDYNSSPLAFPSPAGAPWSELFVQGAAPNRKAIIHIRDWASLRGGAALNTLQIHLYEATGLIEIHVLNLDPGGNSTMGVENASGTLGTTVSGRNNSSWTSSNEAWRFKPDFGDSYTATWQVLPSGATIASGDSAKVAPTSPTSYQLTLTDDGSGCFKTFVVPGPIERVSIDAGPNQTIPVGGTALMNGTYNGMTLSNCTTYLASGIAHNSQTLSSPTNLSLSDDALTTAIPLGFSFDYYCASYSQVYICSNGWLTFSNPAGNTVPGPFNMPVQGLNDMISFCATDLDPSLGGNVRYQTLGLAPNRKFVVSFEDIRYEGSTNKVSVQAILYETTNYIEVHNTNIEPTVGRNITQGVRDDNVNFLDVPGRGNNIVTSTISNEAWRLRPQLNNLTYSWCAKTGTAGPAIPNLFGSLNDSTFEDPAARPPGTVGAASFFTYYLKVDNGECSMIDSMLIQIGPLAAELLSFTAEAAAGRAELAWQTAQEVNTDFFIVEHSADNLLFRKIGRKEAAGNATTTQNYAFQHRKVNDGFNYYRLKMLDKDGSSQYSSVLSLSFEKKNHLTIAPNPSDGIFVLEFELNEPANVLLEIAYIRGQIIRKTYYPNQQPGTIIKTIDLLEMPPGIYIYTLSINGKRHSGKLYVR